MMPQSARISTTTCPKPVVLLEVCQREYEHNNLLHLSMKIQVYRAVVIPTILYSAETWVLYPKQIRPLEQFHQHCLHSILGIKWQDYMSNKEVLKKASLPSRVHLASGAAALGRPHLKDGRHTHAQSSLLMQASRRKV